jgi:hypothetical protein
LLAIALRTRKRRMSAAELLESLIEDQLDFRPSLPIR